MAWIESISEIAIPSITLKEKSSTPIKNAPEETLSLIHERIKNEVFRREMGHWVSMFPYIGNQYSTCHPLTHVSKAQPENLEERDQYDAWCARCLSDCYLKDFIWQPSHKRPPLYNGWRDWVSRIIGKVQNYKSPSSRCLSRS